ncbi:MAG: DUF3551 domain-containing protein [Rhizobiales bacterium]|nr:DUF3551 domain-containing protein [Hyphomicrobiales bacterium]
MLRSLLIGAVAATALAGLGASPASARDYPFCATQGGWGSYENCGYSTMQQCMAAVSGVGGFCKPNPRYAVRSYPDDYAPAPPRRYR